MSAETKYDLRHATSSEVIRIHQMERDEARRLDKVNEGQDLSTPPAELERQIVESPRLNSLEEGASICQGFDGDERCGDEVPKGVELCKSCERAEQKRLNLEAWERDGHEPIVFYPHLAD